MKQLNHILFVEKKVALVFIITSLAMGTAIIAQAYFFVSIIDRIFLQNQSFQSVVPMLTGLFAVLTARAVLAYINGLVGVKMASKAKTRLREALIRQYTENPVQAALQGQSGGKVSIMLDAVDEIDSYFSQYVPQVIKTSIIPLMILMAVFSQHLHAGLIMAFTAPLIPLFFIMIGISTKKKSEQQLEKLAAFSGTFLDTLQGLTTLKLFGKAAKQKKVIQKSSMEFRDATMEILKVAFSSSLMVEFISILSIGLIALDVASQLVLFEQINFFVAFFVLILAPEFYSSLKELSSAFHTGRGSMGAAQKVADELNQPGHPVEWGDREFLNVEEPPEIVLQGAHFGYGENNFALKDIRLRIPPYQHIAIVGRSGAGKTTLLHGIAGLIGVREGELLVNDVPLSDYKEKAWYDKLSYISQHPYLFSGTIAENIAVGSSGQAERKEIEAAAEKAGIKEMVEKLENGYDTRIGEAGRGLSGGEKQRIAIARAFLKNPSIILFDEPTTGLDLQTEQILQQSIKELSRHSTVITVAHRLHTIKEADQIVFLENGRLAATGKHEQLAERVPEYREMVSVQQGGLYNARS